MSKKKPENNTPKKTKRSLRRIIWNTIKIGFFVSVFIFVSLTVLNRVGGDAEMYQTMTEEIITNITEKNARIGKFNGMYFFPYISLDFEDLVITDTDQAETILLTADHIKFSVDFWDVIARRGYFHEFYIDNLQTGNGYISEEPLIISEAHTDSQDGQAPSLTLKGQWGQDPINGSISLTEIEAPPYQRYKLGGEGPLTLSLGSLKLSAQATEGHSGKTLYNLTFKQSDIKLLAGALAFTPALDGQFTIVETGDTLNVIAEGKGANTYDINLHSPDFTLQNVSADSKLRKAIDSITQKFSSNKSKPNNVENAPPFTLTSKVTIDNVRNSDTSYGSAKFDIAYKNKILTINPGGKFLKSHTSGSIVHDGSKLPATLDVDLIIEGIDYGNLQSSVTGSGTAKITLKGSGDTAETLKQSLHGSISFIGGEGKLASGALNLWGGGLLNKLMPDLSATDALSVSCIIADFKVDEGKATSNALFLDAARVTIAGEGDYDIAKDKLSISLKPKSKSIAIGSLASAVKITGPIASPSIRPDMLSLGKSIGGLLLGTINPAFLALSFTDLGLSENHPCKQYIDTNDKTDG